MAAGDLENILMTAPDSTMHSSRVRNIYWRDHNNVNRSVKYVYWCPDGQRAHLIWQRDHIQRTLLAGDKNVAIEYTPATNIVISGIEIFTSQDSSHTAGRVKIIHESGLFVGSVNGDAKDGSTELYGLTGWKRYVNNASIQLYGGKKYYIVFNDDNPVTAYYPAYFQGETGNYKEYSNDTDNVTLTDISNYGDYIGYVDNLAAVINTSIANLFIWNSDENYNNAVLKNKCYSRANKDMTGKTLYSNVTLGQNNSHALDDNDKAIIASMSANTVFVWIGQTNKGMTNGTNYVKKSGIPEAKVSEDFSGLSDNSSKIAKLLLDTKNAAVLNGAVSCTSNIWGEYQDGLAGSLVTLKSGYSVQYDSMTPATVDPDTPTLNGIYYFNNSNGKTGVYICTDATNKSYKQVNQYNWSGDQSGSPYVAELVNKYATTDTIETWGTVADWVSFVAENNAITLTLASAETKHDRKYYVKLTDSNNNSFEV